ncbi:MAG: DUF1573 domain-containing protein [Crocinitomicaceae bacterium]|nr:DUF1573 domain-containing protein [Crocinitomicaceae bacterium]
MKKIVVSLFALAALIVSCNESENTIKSVDGEVTSTVIADSDNEAKLNEELSDFEKEEAAREKEKQSNLTSLEFDKVLHDFGDVQPEVENTTSFIVKNTGNKPLIISDVSATCGCTTPKKPEAPIPPGQSDEIMVTFKSKPGQKNEITKTVTVTANTADKVHKVDIRAFVK